ncbi:MAG: hypothetical protein ACRCT8_12125 [Lacipirellulaceae bacterium]
MHPTAMSEAAAAAAVRVEPHSENTCAIFVAAKRLGYVGYGSPAPINWLSQATTGGVAITTEERIAMVARVRELMAARSEERLAATERLRLLEAGLADPATDAPA